MSNEDFFREIKGLVNFLSENGYKIDYEKNEAHNYSSLLSKISYVDHDTIENLIILSKIIPTFNQYIRSLTTNQEVESRYKPFKEKIDSVNKQIKIKVKKRKSKIHKFWYKISKTKEEKLEDISKQMNDFIQSYREEFELINQEILKEKKLIEAYETLLKVINSSNIIINNLLNKIQKNLDEIETWKKDISNIIAQCEDKNRRFNLENEELEIESLYDFEFDAYELIREIQVSFNTQILISKSLLLTLKSAHKNRSQIQKNMLYFINLDETAINNVLQAITLDENLVESGLFNKVVEQIKEQVKKDLESELEKKKAKEKELQEETKRQKEKEKRLKEEKEKIDTIRKKNAEKLEKQKKDAKLKRQILDDEILEKFDKLLRKRKRKLIEYYTLPKLDFEKKIYNSNLNNHLNFNKEIIKTYNIEKKYINKINPKL